MSDQAFPRIRAGGGNTHAVFASGGPGDGSLADARTICGLRVRDLNTWCEEPTGAPVTCKNCRRSLEATRHSDPRANATLQWMEMAQ